MRYRFQFRRYRLPFRAAVRTAHGLWTEREGVVVRLEAEEQGAGGGEQAGPAGWGEAAPIPWFGTETADEVEAGCRDMGEWVDDERLERVPARLGCLRNAIAAAKAEVTLLRAQGAEKAPASQTAYLGVAALLPAGKAALSQIAAKAESGYRVFKWKVGVGDIADELVLLDDVCAALPEGAKLRLDANGAWDRRKAERWLERCAERPVEFVEQPIAADAKGAQDLLLGLAGDFPTQIGLDESLVGEGDVEKWLGAGWPGVFVVKPALLGDAAGALARLEKAKADVVFSSALETAVGARAALRVAFRWAARRAEQAGGSKAQARPGRALGFGVWPLFQDGRFDGPAAAPFVRAEDVERIDAEAVWNALS